MERIYNELIAIEEQCFTTEEWEKASSEERDAMIEHPLGVLFCNHPEMSNGQWALFSVYLEHENHHTASRGVDRMLNLTCKNCIFFRDGVCKADKDRYLITEDGRREKLSWECSTLDTTTMD